MADESIVTVDKVSHWFGTGALRHQLLFEVSTEIHAGEVVLVTGPSGSGKTTLLTLIGALRSAQAGSLRVLGTELRDAPEGTLVRVRQQIGYIFQLHNLINALTLRQNVTMALRGEAGLTREQGNSRAGELLGAVGLAAHADRDPARLSAGQKQRVAVARALVGRPRLVLADEPTASLDKQSGRDVVDLLRRLARERGTAVILVTHDNRILDVADRILHLEEGRLTSFTTGAAASTELVMGALADPRRKDEFLREVEHADAAGFARVLSRVTQEAQYLLQVMTAGADGVLERMLDQVLETLAFKIGQLLHADRVSVLLSDEARGELWSKVAQADGGRPVEIRIPIGTGIAGHVYRSNELMNVPNAYESSLFNPAVDRETGYHTRSVLCAPIRDRDGHPFAVVTLLNKRTGPAFDAGDEHRLEEFARPLGVVLETWHRLSRRATRDLRASPAVRRAAEA
jgi:putative ABC transport system ATP-binding protein